jgi:hypothetical protein
MIEREPQTGRSVAVASLWTMRKVLPCRRKRVGARASAASGAANSPANHPVPDVDKRRHVGSVRPEMARQRPRQAARTQACRTAQRQVLKGEVQRKGARF